MKTNTCLNMAMILILVIGSLTVTAHGNVVQQVQGGQVDWTNGYIYATAYKAIDQYGIQEARTQAYDLAATELNKIVNGVRIDEKRIYEHSTATDAILKTETQGLIKMAVPVRDPKDEFEDININGQVKTHIVRELKMPLYGPKGLFKPLAAHIERHPENLAARPRYDAPVQPAAQSYTGLIVDCRGLGVVPSLHPLILVEDQFKMIYGPDSIKSRDIYMNGVVLYTDTPARARNNERAGNNPLTVKAVSAAGQIPTNVVVTVADAKTIMSADLDTQILSRANVIFVVGDK